MTSQKQTDANRRNAFLSTGPRTEDGKQQARCNAYSHGLTAETVIVGAEDAAEYAAFEAEIVSEYAPKSVVERELTHRLASLLWRLRRASLIDSGLLSVGVGDTKGHNGGPENARKSEKLTPRSVVRWLETSINQAQCSDLNRHQELGSKDADIGSEETATTNHNRKQLALTRSFLRLTMLESAPMERISRYEASLWRQFVQVLFALDQAKYHSIAASRGRFVPRPPQW